MNSLAIMVSWLVVLAPVARADCGAAERTLFSCLTAKDMRVEVCNFGQTIQYSFGNPREEPEVAISVPIKRVTGESCYACGRYISSSVNIPNGDTIYRVSWSVDKTNTEAPSEGGVEVVINGESRTNILCASEPIIGNIEGIAFNEPVDGK